MLSNSDDMNVISAVAEEQLKEIYDYFSFAGSHPQDPIYFHLGARSRVQLSPLTRNKNKICAMKNY